MSEDASSLFKTRSDSVAVIVTVATRVLVLAPASMSMP